MTDVTVTLDNCEREPIHIPGAIQPHGVLFACRGADVIVKQASKNVPTFFDAIVQSVLERPLEELLDADSAATFREAVKHESLREVNPVRLTSRAGIELEALLHRSGDVLVVEVERATPDQGLGFDPRLRAAVYRLQQASDVESLCRIAAEETRALTGFDRTMVYRFDADWNGEVVAESKREDLESFLGHHYPSSDIPAQARRLYTENWLRLIGDVAYEPVPLEPVLDPVTKAPLDLSQAGLRSVSPIHIEYLRNMGVGASMSISLVIDGKLAGLIACHHYSGAHLVPFVVRDTVEYLGQALSWNLRVLEAAEDAERARQSHEHSAAIVSSIAASDDLGQSLATPALMKLADAQGLAVVMEERVRCVGSTPSSEQIGIIVDWLKANGHQIFSTDHLAKEIAAAADWDTTSAGLVAVAVAHDLGEYILWFRPATERTISWAGNPAKVLVPGKDGAPPRLSPRGSFELWREVVRGRALPWEKWQVGAAASIRAALLGGVRRRAAALRTLNQQLVDADRAKDTFIATVSHELRTPLNAISGWARLMTGGNVGQERWPRGLEVIQRNTDTLSELVEDLIDVSRITTGKLALDIHQVDFGGIVDSAIDAITLSAEAKSIRVKRVIDSGSVVLGDPTRVRQIVNNLLTNAVKFTPKGGKVTITLQRISSEIELAVKDSGQGIEPEFLPHVFEAFRQADGSISRRAHGLGLGLAIVKKLVELHGGSVAVESDGEGKGSTFRVKLPIAAVHREKHSEPISRHRLPDQPSLDGVRVLVLEDEDDSRDVLRLLLEGCGATVVACEDAKLGLRALDAPESGKFDIIISDIGMPEMDGFAFIRAVRARPAPQGGNIPAVALTAYTRSQDRTTALLAGFQAHVPKPADPDELLAVVASMLGRLVPSSH